MNSTTTTPANIIYFDLETTGLNQYHDKITDLCFMRENFRVRREPEKFQTLINPEKNISAFITRLTGISNEMVINQPTFSQVSNNLLNFINGPNPNAYLIAHNGDGFDKIILRVHYKNLTPSINTNTFPWRTIDTLLMSRKLYPHFFKHNLKSLMEQLGLEKRAAHRAEADTLMLRDLYRKMCLDLAKNEKIGYEYVWNHPEYVWNYINN